jgi:hypothetical protein
MRTSLASGLLLKLVTQDIYGLFLLLKDPAGPYMAPSSSFPLSSKFPAKGIHQKFMISAEHHVATNRVPSPSAFLSGEKHEPWMYGPGWIKVVQFIQHVDSSHFCSSKFGKCNRIDAPDSPLTLKSIQATLYVQLCPLLVLKSAAEASHGPLACILNPKQKRTWPTLARFSCCQKAKSEFLWVSAQKSAVDTHIDSSHLHY